MPPTNSGLLWSFTELLSWVEFFSGATWWSSQYDFTWNAGRKTYWTVFKCSMALDLISFALFDVYLSYVCHWITAKLLYTSTGSWHVLFLSPSSCLNLLSLVCCLLMPIKTNIIWHFVVVFFYFLCWSSSILLNYKCLGPIFPHRILNFSWSFNLFQLYL